jgi:malonyl-CoA/methylmalonyl-CoA synthetase
VVGVPDEEWGDRVCAAVELRAAESVDADDVKEWLKDRLAPYKVPKEIAFVDALPRNAMGKPLKPAITPLFRSP